MRRDSIEILRRFSISLFIEFNANDAVAVLIRSFRNLRSKLANLNIACFGIPSKPQVGIVDGNPTDVLFLFPMHLDPNSLIALSHPGYFVRNDPVRASDKTVKAITVVGCFRYLNCQSLVLKKFHRFFSSFNEGQLIFTVIDPGYSEFRFCTGFQICFRLGRFSSLNQMIGSQFFIFRGKDASFEVAAIGS